MIIEVMEATDEDAVRILPYLRERELSFLASKDEAPAGKGREQAGSAKLESPLLNNQLTALLRKQLIRNTGLLSRTKQPETTGEQSASVPRVFIVLN